MRRDQLPPHKTATYVLPQWHTVYVSVPNAACTSLKWLLADLQGERRADFEASLSREVTRELTIHQRKLWRHTPMLPQLPPDELAPISPDNGWFVFAVVRHPAARLWSGWQSKFLLQEPRFMALFGDEPWARREVPTSTEEVVAAFHAFASSIGHNPGQPVMKDRHFWRQTELLAHGRTPYTRVYRTSEIPSLLDDLSGHLRAQGWDGELGLGRSNETPLRPVREVFSPDVVGVLQDIYAADYDAYGYDDVLPGGLEESSKYTDDVLNEVARLVERHQRIGDLATASSRLRARLAAAERRAAARSERDTPTAEAPALTGPGRNSTKPRNPSPSGKAATARRAAAALGAAARRLPGSARTRLRELRLTLRGY